MEINELFYKPYHVLNANDFTMKNHNVVCKAKILLFCFVLGNNSIILLFNLVVKLRVEKNFV